MRWDDDKGGDKKRQRGTWNQSGGTLLIQYFGLDIFESDFYRILLLLAKSIFDLDDSF